MTTDEAERLLTFLRAPEGDRPAGRFPAVDLRAEAVRPLLGDPLPDWWDAAHDRVRVLRASAPNINLAGANLTGVSLEQADLRGADLGDAVLTGAILGGADLTEALLEDAKLQKAHLRFATLTMAALEGADLTGADLWGAKCREADIDRVDFRGAELEEADLRDTDARECDFREARLGQTDFRGADLRRSDFRGAVFRATKFDGADLRMANLEYADLSNCSLAGVRVADARLERTRVRATQFGDAIGEELAGDWESAERGYLTLERNFIELGDPDAASWAYRRRRRMAKRNFGRLAREQFRAGKPRGAAHSAYAYLSDWLVELVCDYGESLVRIFLTYLVLFALFGLGYAATGAVSRQTPTPDDPDALAVTHSVQDVVLFTFTAMIAPSEKPEGIMPSSDPVQFVMLFQSSLGIFLIGLLGFVAGNRIRR